MFSWTIVWNVMSFVHASYWSFVGSSPFTTR